MIKSFRNPVLALIFLISLTNTGFSQSNREDFPGDDRLYALSVADFSDAGQFHQLEPFFSNRLIIAAGEATHGTHDFFVLRSVLFSYLVKEHDFKMIAIEMDFAACQLINDYIQNGSGTIDSSLNLINGSFLNTTEFRDLVSWMRQHNVSLPDSDKIALKGIDMQEIGPPVDRLKWLIHQNAPPVFNSLNNDIIGSRDLSRDKMFFAPFSPSGDSVITSLLSMNAGLQKWLKDNTVILANKLPLTIFQEVEMCVTIINQSVKYFTESKTMPNQYRDSCMAENVKKLSNKGKNKIFVWAHNGHVTKNAGNIDQSLKLGSYLARYYADGFYNIGFVFNEGSFIARKGANSTFHNIVRRKLRKYSVYPRGIFSLPPLGKSSFTGILARANMPNFFVDLNTSTSAVFSKTLPSYQLGAVYMNRNLSVSPFHAKDNFNAIIFVDKTSATSPLQ